MAVNYKGIKDNTFLGDAIFIERKGKYTLNQITKQVIQQLHPVLVQVRVESLTCVHG